jgi:hypothetical protein
MAPAWCEPTGVAQAPTWRNRREYPRRGRRVSAQTGRPGLRFLDYTGRTVAW